MRCLWIGLFVGLLVSAGCGILPGSLLPGGTACTELYAYGVSVTVTNAINGNPVNNATLTLSDGSYNETMQWVPTGDYVGAGERAGTYALTVTAPGFQSQTIGQIVVTADACHVQGVHLTVELVPQQ
jgi:hypothetical protein